MTFTSKITNNYAFATNPVSALRAEKMLFESLARFLRDDRGEHAIEFLMILTFGVLPIIAAVFLLEDVLQEYVAYSQIFVSSPFF